MDCLIVMTPAEEIALNEAKAALSPHFDAFVITTRVADGGDRINTDWHGALSDVIGLNRITQLRMERIAADRSGDVEF